MRAKTFVSLLDSKEVCAFDFGNGHLMLCLNEIVIDSDRAILEDAKGFRFLRDIKAEVVSRLPNKRYTQI